MILSRRIFVAPNLANVVRLVERAALTCVAAIAFLLLLAAGSAIAKQVRTKAAITAHQVVIQPSNFESVTDTCPASYPHPVGPQFSYVNGASTPGSVALTASYPRGGRGWLIAVENMTNQPQAVSLGIVCVRANAAFAYPRTANTVAGPSGYSAGQSDCPRSAPHPIDNFFGMQSAANTGLLLLAGAYPFSSGNAAGTLTGVRNSASDALLFFAGTVCTSLRTATSFVRGSVAAGQSNGATIRCPRQTPVAIGGMFYPLPPESTNPDNGRIEMVVTFPAANNAWAIAVASLSDHTVQYAVGAVCLG
jgi:hypothetical protein